MNKPFCVLMVLGLFGGSALSAELPDWLKDVKVKGDLRLRLEGKDSDSDTVKTRNRARFRFRLALDKKFNDALAVGFRLASGSGDPTSTNQSFDNSFSGKDLVLDRAYVTYKKSGWELGGGKLKNPFHSSDIVWDTDVNPEGFYQRYTSGGFYAVLGEMFVEEERSGDDVNLYAGQLGFKLGERTKWNLSVAFYNYENLIHLGNGAAGSNQFIDLLATVKLDAVKLTFDYVKNTSSLINDQDTAWSVIADFGGGQSDWTFQVKYAEIELNSIEARFSDSDFGFTDKKGFVARVGYKSSKHVSWKANFFGVDDILADSGFNYLQLDCALKF